MNELFQNALKKKNQKCPPVWMMRQAGRYHQHYQKMRLKHSFMDLCKIPELAAEVAFGPVDDFDFDVSIMFSDLLFPLEALGTGLEYTDQGPRLGIKLTEDNIKNLKSIAEALPALEFQKDVLQHTRERLPKNKSLIGFVGGPWTLFVYSTEGSHAGQLTFSKSAFALQKTFFPLMTNLLIENIKIQLDGGAEAVMILDTAAGEVSPDYFQRHLEKDLIQMAKAFPYRLGYYSKGSQSGFFSEAFLSAPWAGFGFDHRYDLAHQLKTQQKGFTQGNFDQGLLFLNPEDFKKEFQSYLLPFKNMRREDLAGWVCGVGHGLLPKTPEANVRSFVEILRKTFS